MTRLMTGRFVCLLAIACLMSACGRPVLGRAAVRQPQPQVALLELWNEPTDLSTRDLLWGSARREHAPSTRDLYTVVKVDKTGFSRGYDVTAPDGRAWDIKVGKEVQPEIVLSRILWALGYYQPETYYVTGWELAGSYEFEGEPARFRLQSDHKSDGEWAWLENPFVGTRPLQGLIAINLLLNNHDLKTSNNRIYRLADDKAEPARRYVVQDVGSALGEPRGFPYIRGTRNDIDDYEDHTFIRKIDGSSVQLDYRGHYADILEHLTAPDIIWACELLNRLSDAQLDDAFKAAEYAPEIRQRYITKLRDKIREGLALRDVQQGKLPEAP